MSGIYSIRCLINNKRYIGSCSNFKNRKNIHFGLLKNNVHSNKLLLEDYNKYGKINFVFEIIEKIQNNDNTLIEKENYWMDYYKTNIKKYGNDFGYNQRYANRVNKEKISQSRKGQKLKEETKRKISEKLKGRESKRKGNKLSEEHRNNIKKAVQESKNPKSKLTLEQCKNIYNLANCSNYTINELSTMFNVTVQTIYNIKKGNHWSFKHIKRAE